MAEVALVVGSLAVACLSWVRSGDRQHPVLLLAAAFAVVATLRIAVPVGLTPISGAAAGIVVAGLVSVAAGAGLAPATTPPARNATPVPPRPARVGLLLVLGVAGLAAGVVAFRRAIASAAGGSYEHLTAQQVRYYQVYSEARHSGLPTALLTLTPIVACLGVLLARRHGWGWAFVLVALGASAQSPARTATLYAGAITLVFALRIGAVGNVRRRYRQHTRRWALALVALGATGAVGYFSVVASALNKTSFTQDLPGPVHLPTAISGPLVYTVGGLSALSVAQESHVNPSAGNDLRSLWLIPRVASMVDPSVAVPDTIAGYVDIPIPFNVYTWAGDLYFDVGLVGLVLVSAAVGLLAASCHGLYRRRPTPTTVWLSTVTTVTLVGCVISFRFLVLDTLIWIVGGALAFRFVTAPGPKPALAAT